MSFVKVRRRLHGSKTQRTSQDWKGIVNLTIDAVGRNARRRPGTRAVALLASLFTLATMGIAAGTMNVPTASAGQAPDNRGICKTYATEPTMITTAYHTSPELPCTIGGKHVTWSAIAWSRNQYKTPFSTVTASGYTTDDAGAKTVVSIPVEVLPANVRYFIDSGTNGAETDEFKTVKASNPDLLNDKTDQVSADANTWGYAASDAVKVKGGANANDKYDTGLYGPVVYRLPLKAGKYSLDAGFKGWWGNAGNATQTVSVDGTQLATNSTYVGANANAGAAKLDFTLDRDATVEYTVGGLGRVSWLVVSEQYDLPKVYLSYGLEYSKTPSNDQADAYWRIVNAADAAVDRWNTWSNENPDKAADPHYFTAYYNPGIPTAQTNPNYAMGGHGYTGWGPGTTGRIGWGKNRGFMVEGTALHEIGHLFGSGYYNYGNYCVGGVWKGPNGIAALKSFGTGETLSCGGVHMWPYGNNYATEWDGLNAADYETHMNRVVAMFSGMSRDAENPAPYFTVRTVGEATQYSAYDQTIRVAGQSNQGNPITVTLADGKLPAGVTLDPTDRAANGTPNGTDDKMYIHIKGRPTEAGTFKFTLKAANRNKPDDTAEYTLVVKPTSAADFVVGTYNAADTDDVASLLPTVKNINSNTKVSDIKWNLNGVSLKGQAWKTVTVEGTGTVTRTDTNESFDRPLSATINVVPSGLVYYIDAGTGANGSATIASPAFNQVAGVASLKGKLLNTVSDQQSTDANTWGLIDSDATRRINAASTAVRDTGWYAKGDTLSYRLPLKAGKYTATSESARWLGVDRTITPSVSWTDADGKTQTVPGTGDVNLVGQANVYGTGTVEFELKTDAVVTYTLTKKSGGTPTIDSLYVVKTGEAAPATKPVTAVTVSGDATIETGRTSQLTAKVEPADAADATVTWQSSNEDVATVDQNGLVTAKKAGAATITATSKAVPTVSGKLDITVSDPATTPTVDKTALKAKVDATPDATNRSEYTVGSWRGYAAARTKAQNVLADGNATQAQVNHALATLTNAANRLRLR